MDEEKIIIQSEEEQYDAIDIQEDNQDVNRNETVEYINVDTPETITITSEEAFPALGEINPQLNHSLLTNRDLPDQHPIEAITGLESVLNTLSSTKNIYTKSGGLAEFRKWADDNKEGRNRIGYFVSIVNNDGEIAICDGNNDVYGVVVAQSGVCGYQDSKYDSIDTTTPNKADDWIYAKVCLVGDVRVRVNPDDKISVGDYVLPNSLGYASVSENGIGFRVSSIGSEYLKDKDGSEIIAHFVTISLVPQNDNISRVMSKLKGTQDSLNNVVIDIGDLKNGLESISDSNIKLGEGFDGLQDLIGELENNVHTIGNALTDVEKVAQDAQKNTNSALEKVNLAYTNAISQATSAREDANSALADVESLRDNLQPLVEWKNGDYEGIAGFVKKSNEESTQLGTLATRIDENGTSIGAINTVLDKNGAQIRHLVAHADRYSVGPLSTSNGLSDDAAKEILHEGHIYVPTSTHQEDKAQFESGKVYRWTKLKDASDNNIFMWKEATDITLYSNTESIPSGTNEGDLWYCWQGILDDNNTYVYSPETLYRWESDEWVSVATIDGNIQSRSIGLIVQTDKKLSSLYTDLWGNVSTIDQAVDNISTVVLNVDGQGSTLQQAADKIIAGTFNPESSTSLALLLDGLTNTSSYEQHIHTNSFSGTIDAVGNKYSVAPTWDEVKGVFVFDENHIDTDGIYYFYSEDHTRYCKIVDDGYQIYTIGNIALASINARTSKNEASIDTLTTFKTDTANTLATISQKTDANSAEIISVASGNYVMCTDIKSELTDEEKEVIQNITKYATKPIWSSTENCFKFNGYDSEDGLYYMLDNDSAHYYKLITQDGNIIGYEKYGIASSGSAYLAQKVNSNSSSIGMVVDSNGVKGTVLVDAINGQSSALIGADKILMYAAGESGETSDTDLKSYIQVESGKISQIVSSVGSDGEVTAASIVSAINSTGSDVTISADKVNLSGYVTIASLSGDGTTIINGSNITTGIIKSADYSEPVSPSVFATSGTKFDLENGSINSKNFNIDTDGNVTISGKITATDGNIGGFTIGATSIYNKQTTYNGSAETDSDGVYIGTNGIGLGKGKFYVTNNGDVTMSGNINMSNGHISWSSSNSPVQVQYSATGTSWHETFAQTDYYARYSYDGGTTWTDAIKIQGKDGKDGIDGDDADVTYVNIKSALERASNAAVTFIDGDSVDTANIYANNIYGGKIYAGEGTNGYIEMSTYTASDYTICPCFSMYGIFGESLTNVLNIYYHDSNTDPRVVFGSSSSSYATWDYADTIFTDAVKFDGTVNFSGATVTGLNIVAVFG